LIGKMLSHYRVVAQLGKGGMGEVYRAEDTKLGREVALKVLPREMAGDPERLERFKREARTLAAVDHPNIVTIYSVDEADGVHFVTMGLVEGRTLGELIPRSGLDLAKFFELAIPLAEALAAAHSRSITHRDLKPANVMVDDEDRRVKVLDFGLAKLQATTGDLDETLAQTMAMTQDGVVLGTLPYMSPEQAEGKDVDQRSDIFSLGIILYEMITGSRPFQGDNAARLLSSILTETPAPVLDIKGDLPRHLDRIARRCLAKNPKERFQTAQDVYTELKELAREVELGTTATGVSPQAAAPLAISRRTAVIAAAVAVAVLGSLGLYWSKGRSLAPKGISSPAMITSIVALPSVVNGLPEQEYLTDAVPSTLTTQLSGIENLDTKLPPTSVEYDKLDRDIARVVTACKVSAYIASTINPDADGFRLDVQLIDADDRSVLWGNSYRATPTNYLDLVRQAAGSILSQIRPSSGPLQAKALTTSVEAELALRRGEHYWARYGGSAEPRFFDLAKAAFEEALEHDPGLARAAAGIGTLYVIRSNYLTDPAEGAEVAAGMQSWGQRAVDIDPTDGAGWAILYNYENTPLGTLDSEARFELATRAAALAPDSFMAQNALALALTSSTLRIAASAELAQRFPLESPPKLNAALDLLELDRCQEALEQVTPVLDLDPKMPFALPIKTNALLCLGRFEEAKATIEVFASVVADGKMPPAFLESLRWGLAAASGDMGEPEAWETLVASLPTDPTGNALYFLQPNFFRWDRSEEALALCEQCGWATWFEAMYYDALILSPVYEVLRQQPEFEEIDPAKRARFEGRLARLDAARARGELPSYLEQPLADLREQLGLYSPSASSGS
jgi:serine/threonine protein kinase